MNLHNDIDVVIGALGEVPSDLKSATLVDLGSGIAKVLDSSFNVRYNGGWLREYDVAIAEVEAVIESLRDQLHEMAEELSTQEGINEDLERERDSLVERVEELEALATGGGL